MTATRCRQVRSGGSEGPEGSGAAREGSAVPLGIGAPGRSGAHGASGVSPRCLWRVPGGFLLSEGCFQLNRNCIPSPPPADASPPSPPGCCRRRARGLPGPGAGEQEVRAAPCAGGLFARWGAHGAGAVFVRCPRVFITRCAGEGRRKILGSHCARAGAQSGTMPRETPAGTGDSGCLP